MFELYILRMEMDVKKNCIQHMVLNASDVVISSFYVHSTESILSDLDK